MEIELAQEYTKEQINIHFRKHIQEDDIFAAIFYVLSTIEQFYKLGFCECLTTLPEGTQTLFLSMRDHGYELDDEDLRAIVDLSNIWTDKQKKQVLQYYKAYHNMKWDMEKGCWTQKS